MFWFAAACIAAALLIWFLPLRARVDAALAGRAWEVRVAWLAPVGRLAIWRVSWRGRVAPGRLARDLQALRRRSTWGLARELADWIPLFVILHFARLESAGLRIRFGTGDPALTGIASGCIWSLAAAAATWFEQRFGPLRSRPRLQVTPDFYRARWEVRAACIGSSRPRDIIVALLWTLVIGIRHAWRRGVKSATWKDIPSKVS